MSDRQQLTHSRTTAQLLNGLATGSLLVDVGCIYLMEKRALGMEMLAKRLLATKKLAAN